MWDIRKSSISQMCEGLTLLDHVSLESVCCGCVSPFQLLLLPLRQIFTSTDEFSKDDRCITLQFS